MKIILLFDSDKSDKLDNCYREFELSDDLVESLKEGKDITFTFCHPKHGEVMLAELAKEQWHYL